VIFENLGIERDNAGAAKTADYVFWGKGFEIRFSTKLKDVIH